MSSTARRTFPFLSAAKITDSLIEWIMTRATRPLLSLF